MKETLGGLIQKRRKDLKITSTVLAGRIGIDRTYITKIESNAVMPHRKLMEHIAQELSDSSLVRFYFKIKRNNLSQKLKTLADDEIKIIKQLKSKIKG